jgi:hypothetical protein
MSSPSSSPHTIPNLILDAINGVSVIRARAQMVRRRWMRLDHPLADVSVHELALIDASCVALAEDIRRLHHASGDVEDILDRHVRQLAELRRLLDVDNPDIVAIRHLAAQDA